MNKRAVKIWVPNTPILHDAYMEKMLADISRRFWREAVIEDMKAGAKDG